jgi:hypothetical protein
MPFCNPDQIIIPEGRFRTATINDPEVVAIAESINGIGQLQPILVTKGLELVDGLHRLLGCRRLKRDIWYEDEETGRLKFENPEQRRRAEFQANMRRKDFTPLELAKGIAELDMLMRETYGEKKAGPGIQDGWTQSETAKMLGFKSHRKVSEALAIAKAADSGTIPSLKNARTWQAAFKMVSCVPKAEKPISHKTFLPIEKETDLFHQGIRYRLQLFDNENKFEKFIYDNSKLFFGENNHFVDAKHKIKAPGFNVIPDGFLFDNSNENKPLLYLVENEIYTHSFDHIAKHIMTFNNLIINEWKEIVNIVSKYIPHEMQLSLHKCTSLINFGILIIIDKEDDKIAPLINFRPDRIINYKIISIETYNNVELNDVIFVKSEFNQNTEIQPLTGVLPQLDLSDFE